MTLSFSYRELLQGERTEVIISFQFLFLPFFFFFKQFVCCMCVHVSNVCTLARTFVGVNSLLPLWWVLGLKQVIRLACMCLYLLSHLTHPSALCLNATMPCLRDVYAEPYPWGSLSRLASSRVASQFQESSLTCLSFGLDIRHGGC